MSNNKLEQIPLFVVDRVSTPPIKRSGFRTIDDLPATSELLDPQAVFPLRVGSSDFKGTYSDISHIYYAEDYGMVGDGTTDNTTAFQNLIDIAEGGIIFIPRGTYLIGGTIYFGNCIYQGAGIDETIIFCNVDSGWSENGTADRKSEGCLINKACTGALYGITPATGNYMVFRDLTFKMTADTSAGPKTLFVTEYWNGGGADNVKWITESCTRTTEISVFDLYKGCRNLGFDKVIWDNRGAATASAGGTWFRQYNETTVPMENITVTNYQVYNTTTDEALAIYNVTSAGVIKNINFNGGYIENDSAGAGESTGTAAGVWFRDAVGGSSEDYQFSLRNTVVKCYVLKNGGACVRARNMTGMIDNVTAIVNDIISGATSAYGFRGDNFSSNNPYATVINSRIISDGTPTEDILSGFHGDLNLINCGSDSVTSGNIRTILKAITGNVEGGNFQGTDYRAADQCTGRISATVAGPMVDCYNVQNSVINIDTDTFTSETPLSATGNAQAKLKWKDIDINITGSNALDTLYNINVATLVDINGLYYAGADATCLPGSVDCGRISTSATGIQQVRNVTTYNGTTRYRFHDNLCPTSEFDFASLLTDWEGVEFYDSEQRDVTIADSANHAGRFTIYDNSPSGTAAHAVVLTAGTFDGQDSSPSHNTATSTGPGDFLIVDFNASGEGTIIAQNGFNLS